MSGLPPGSAYIDASPPEIPKSRLPLIAAAILGCGLALVAVVAVVLLLRGSHKPSKQTAPSASAPSSSVPAAMPPTSAPPTSAPAPAAPSGALSETPARADAGAADAPPTPADPKGEAPASPNVPAGGTEPAAFVPRGPKSAAPAVDPDAFDEAAARTALRRANGVLAFCKRGGPTGPGAATVTFAPSGAVTQVSIAAPYEGTAAGTCVVGQLRRVTTKKFVGAPQTLIHTFSVPN